MSTVDVPVSSLRLGPVLGSGGQGQVFRVLSHPGLAFKRYLLRNVNPAALSALVDFPASLSTPEQDRLRQQAAWPLARVTEQGAAIGFLMAEVPPEFIGRTRAGPQLRELQYLLYEPKPLWGDITPLDADGRLELARQFVDLVRVLQEHSMVLGDISMMNVLWAPDDPPRIFLLDCDGARRLGAAPVLPQPDTPDWGDPLTVPTSADLESDRYKLALVVGRVLSADAEVRPGGQLRVLDGIPERIAEAVAERFAEAAGARGTRPDAYHWARALDGRGMITLPRPVRTPPRPPLPKAELDQRDARGSIPLPPIPRQP